MAINPLQAPINYSAQMVDLGPAFAGAGQAFQSLGESYKAQAKEAEAKAAKQQFAIDLQDVQTKGTQGAWLNMVAKYPQFREAFGDVGKGVEKKRVDTEFTQGFEISNALENNAPEIAIDRVKTIIEAKKNSGESTKIYDDVLTSLQSGNIKGAQNGVNFALLAIDPKRFEESVKAKSAGAEAPAKLRQELASANKAEAEAKVKMETAPDDIAKARATRQFEEAKAKKEQIQADTELKTRLADLGFKQAQTNKFLVETRNLDTTGKMLSLDFAAAAQGLPLPSKKTEGGGGTATEDERKAAGWLAQATNAYNNMLGAMYTKEGKKTGAEAPGKIESALGTLPFIGEGSAALARSTDRQKFTQAASSLSEALLRAATGAGVNRDEAKQKLEELTPLFTDDADTRKQKLEAIPMYLESLKARAGRAAPSGYQIPQAPTNPLAITLPDGTVFTAPNQKTLDEFKRRSGL